MTHNGLPWRTTPRRWQRSIAPIPSSVGTGQRTYLGDDGSEIDSPPNAEHAVDDDGAIRVPERSLDLLDRGHSEVVWHEPAESTVPRSLLLRQAQLLDHCRDRQDRGQQFQGLHAVGTSALRVGTGRCLSHKPSLAMAAWRRIRNSRLASLPKTTAHNRLGAMIDAVRHAPVGWRLNCTE